MSRAPQLATAEVVLYRTEVRAFTVLVKAASEEEARKKALGTDLHGGVLVYSEIEVRSVEPHEHLDLDCDDLDLEGGCDE